MRQAGTLPTRELAQRFADYLLSQGIAAKVDVDGNAWAVWIRDEDQLAKAAAELGQFATNPHSVRYQQAPKAAQELRKQQERDEQLRQRNMIELRDRWNTRPTGRRPLTMILIGICIVVALATDGGENRKSELLQNLFFSPSPSQTNLMERLAWTPIKAIQHGQVWRLVTPIFIHFGPMHLIFNMFALHLLGSLIEVRRGSIRLGLLVLATAVVSNYCQYFIPTHVSWAGEFSIYFGGMSGVIYGLFGYLWIKSRFDPTAGFYLPPNTVAMGLIWLVLCFFGLFGPVANWAHTGGLVTGAVIAYAPVAWRKLTSF